jgi:glycosyltransferase involved in cell wall biosynthesis
MRIFFDGVNFESRTGPNSFALRLARQLSLMGHVVADPDDYDVALVFVEATQRLDRRRPYVHRLDGFWMKPSELASGRNDGIRRTYSDASAVVWQSEFDRGMTLRWFGHPSGPGTVIRNGVPIVPRESIVMPSGLERLRKEHDEVFVCSANWHPQKRLRANIELFRRVRRDPRRSCLIVLGDHPDVVVRSSPDDRVFYAGSIPHDDCLALYSVADWMIHLAWLDHCPNTVVEALSVGTPVVCSPAGGTVELLAGHNAVGQDEPRGLTIDEPPHDMSLADYDSPPDVSGTIDALDHLPMFWPAFDVSDLDIVRCAQSYERVLQGVLR